MSQTFKIQLKQCPGCSQAVPANDVMCRFCRYDFRQVPTQAIQMSTNPAQFAPIGLRDDRITVTRVLVWIRGMLAIGIVGWSAFCLYAVSVGLISVITQMLQQSHPTQSGNGGTMFGASLGMGVMFLGWAGLTGPAATLWFFADRAVRDRSA